MQQTARFSRAHASVSAPSGLRLQPVIHLASGEITALVAETDRCFEDGVRFGPAVARAEGALGGEGALDCLTRLVGEAGALVRRLELAARPVHVPVPMAALKAASLVEAVAGAAERAGLCAQEICLEIADSAFQHRGRDMFCLVRDLRAAGVRAAIDARRSFDAPLSEGLCMLLETMRVRLRDLERSAEAEARVADADAAGIGVIVDGAHWRDGDWLAGLGVKLALRPGLDS